MPQDEKLRRDRFLLLLFDRLSDGMLKYCFDSDITLPSLVLFRGPKRWQKPDLLQKVTVHDIVYENNTA